MRLNEDQKQLVLEHLKKYWPDPQPCPVCRNEIWTLTDTVYEMREYYSGNLVVGGSIFPVVSVTCSTCGNSLFFNAIAIGILPKSMQPATNKPAGA
jgi:hypothetical protein